jgi:hypothetical protein
MKIRTTFIMLMMLCAVICSAQTIRNTNNSIIAKIDTDGTVRNSNNSVIARIVVMAIYVTATTTY